MPSKIYLIPTLLDEDALETIPDYIREAVKDCQVFFVENERTARRYVRKIIPGKEMVIDDHAWFLIDQAGGKAQVVFKQKIKEGKNIGILSEAGCPGIADPGQQLISIAQEMQAEIKPLVGPNSILLALMASGMNGQQFQFLGYLPIPGPERVKKIREIESESHRKNCTQIFIETPYRNNQLIESVIRTCQPTTRFCIAADLTGKKEWIKTKAISEWRREMPDLHKRPAIFLLLAH